LNGKWKGRRNGAARPWAADNFGKLADPDPKMPDLNDRAADNWHPLLAIADLVGGTWPEWLNTVGVNTRELRKFLSFLR